MFDEIKDFIAKHKIWFIIGGIICAMFGAVMAALISLYFLIAVAVGLIVAVASGLVKNKEIKGYEPNTIIEKKYETPDLLYRFKNPKVHEQENNVLYNQDGAEPPVSTPIPDNKELEEYKNEARNHITKEYVQGLLKSVEEGKEINDNQDMYSSLFKKNGFGPRGDGDAFNIIKTHFGKMKIKDVNQNPQVIIRGDIEALFEVLTGCEYKTADYTKKELAVGFQFKTDGYGRHYFSKCFFEHTILCALEIYKNPELLKLYTDEKLTKKQERQQRPLLQFLVWDGNHKHGSVLKQPKTDTSLGQNPSK